MNYVPGSAIERDGGDQPNAGLFKVSFELPEETRLWAPGSTELLWVEKTSVQGEGIVRNVPFYVKDVAYGDTVRVRVDHAARQLVFDEIAGRSGNSTVRVIVKSEEGRERLEAILTEHQCSWEIDSTDLLWAIDVPSEADYADLRVVLAALVESGLVGVEEAYVSVKHLTDLERLSG
ncbi:DUF4265 domain-containing protein [Kribbella swartbergensis]